jgi:hypothetical protein
MKRCFFCQAPVDYHPDDSFDPCYVAVKKERDEIRGCQNDCPCEIASRHEWFEGYCNIRGKLDEKLGIKR